MDEPKATRKDHDEPRWRIFAVQFTPPVGDMISAGGHNEKEAILEAANRLTASWMNIPHRGGWSNVARVIEIDDDGGFIGEKCYRLTLSIDECPADELPWKPKPKVQYTGRARSTRYRAPERIKGPRPNPEGDQADREFLKSAREESANFVQWLSGPLDISLYNLIGAIGALEVVRDVNVDDLLLQFLQDERASIREAAIGVADTHFTPRIQRALREISENDGSPILRDDAKEILDTHP